MNGFDLNSFALGVWAMGTALMVARWWGGRS